MRRRPGGTGVIEGVAGKPELDMSLGRAPDSVSEF